jgi:hypothetical protein
MNAIQSFQEGELIGLYWKSYNKPGAIIKTAWAILADLAEWLVAFKQCIRGSPALAYMP